MRSNVGKLKLDVVKLNRRIFKSENKIKRDQAMILELRKMKIRLEEAIAKRG